MQNCKRKSRRGCQIVVSVNRIFLLLIAQLTFRPLPCTTPTQRFAHEHGEYHAVSRTTAKSAMTDTCCVPEQSLPKALAQILFVGTQIVGRAFLEAGRQAGRNARAGRVEAAAGATSGSGAGSGSPSDQLTRTHRMTLDEAKLILNLKHDISAATLSPKGAAAPIDAAAQGSRTPVMDQLRESLAKNYDHLFATNAPPAPKGAKGGGAGSFYIQSKIVRARERIEAELALVEGPKQPQPEAPGSTPSDGPSPEQRP